MNLFVCKLSTPDRVKWLYLRTDGVHMMMSVLVEYDSRKLGGNIYLAYSLRRNMVSKKHLPRVTAI
jgi:hypothetical protein